MKPSTKINTRIYILIYIYIYVPSLFCSNMPGYPSTPDVGNDIIKWIVVVNVVFMLTTTIGFITWTINTLNKKFSSLEVKIDGHEKQSVAFVEKKIDSVETFLDDHVKAIKEILSESHNACLIRTRAVSGSMEKNLQYIESQVHNMFNTMVELMTEFKPLVVRTDYALKFFEAIMSYHCMEKARIITEAILRHTYPTEDMLNKSVAYQFKKITEESLYILNNVVYSNGHKLSEEIEWILQKDNWDNFINTTVQKLIRIFYLEEDALVIFNGCFTCFWDIVKGMSEGIKKKGGKL